MGCNFSLPKVQQNEEVSPSLVCTDDPKSVLKLLSRVEHQTIYNKIDNSILFLASLESKEQFQSKRQPVDLVVVLDKSGSMEGAKLRLCKQTLDFLIKQSLNEDDFFALVSFDTEVTIEYEGGKMTKENKETVLKKIQTIKVNGSTNLSGGLFQGLDLLKEFGKSKVSAVCLLTDGEANLGLTDKEELIEELKDLLDSFPENRVRPSVFSFGYGIHADSTLLRAIAEETFGTFYNIVDEKTVPISFADCFGGLMSVCAQNIELTCELSPEPIAEFHSAPFTKFPMEFSTSSCKIKIKDMYRGEKRDILFRIQLPAADSLKSTIIQVNCCFMDCNTESEQTISCLNYIHRVAVVQPKGIPDVEIMRHFLRIEAIKTIEESKKEVEAGNLENGRKLIETMLEKKKGILKPLRIREQDDLMISEISTDLTMSLAGMESFETYNHIGRSRMEASVTSHTFQRSNNVERSTETGGEEKSAYITSSKKEMVSTVKSHFDL